MKNILFYCLLGASYLLEKLRQLCFQFTLTDKILKSGFEDSASGHADDRSKQKVVKKDRFGPDSIVFFVVNDLFCPLRSSFVVKRFLTRLCLGPSNECIFILFDFL